MSGEMTDDMIDDFKSVHRNIGVRVLIAWFGFEQEDASGENMEDFSVIYDENDIETINIDKSAEGMEHTSVRDTCTIVLHDVNKNIHPANLDSNIEHNGTTYVDAVKWVSIEVKSENSDWTTYHSGLISSITTNRTTSEVTIDVVDPLYILQEKKAPDKLYIEEMEDEAGELTHRPIKSSKVVQDLLSRVPHLDYDKEVIEEYLRERIIYNFDGMSIFDALEMIMELNDAYIYTEIDELKVKSKLYMTGEDIDTKEFFSDKDTENMDDNLYEIDEVLSRDPMYNKIELTSEAYEKKVAEEVVWIGGEEVSEQTEVYEPEDIEDNTLQLKHSILGEDDEPTEEKTQNVPIVRDPPLSIEFSDRFYVAGQHLSVDHEEGEIYFGGDRGFSINFEEYDEFYDILRDDEFITIEEGSVEVYYYDENDEKVYFEEGNDFEVDYEEKTIKALEGGDIEENETYIGNCEFKTELPDRPFEVNYEFLFNILLPGKYLEFIAHLEHYCTDVRKLADTIVAKNIIEEKEETPYTGQKESFGSNSEDPQSPDSWNTVKTDSVDIPSEAVSAKEVYADIHVRTYGDPPIGYSHWEHEYIVNLVIEEDDGSTRTHLLFDGDGQPETERDGSTTDVSLSDSDEKAWLELEYYNDGGSSGLWSASETYGAIEGYINLRVPEEGYESPEPEPVDTIDIAYERFLEDRQTVEAKITNYGDYVEPGEEVVLLKDEEVRKFVFNEGETIILLEKSTNSKIEYISTTGKFSVRPGVNVGLFAIQYKKKGENKWEDLFLEKDITATEDVEFDVHKEIDKDEYHIRYKAIIDEVASLGRITLEIEELMCEFSEIIYDGKRVQLYTNIHGNKEPKMAIQGTPIKQTKNIRLEKENENSISHYGIEETYTIDNNLFRTNDDARRLVNFMLFNYGVPRSEVAIETIGYPHLRLFDKVELHEVYRDQINNFIITNINDRIDENGWEQVIELQEFDTDWDPEDEISMPERVPDDPSPEEVHEPEPVENIDGYVQETMTSKDGTYNARLFVEWDEPDNLFHEEVEIYVKRGDEDWKHFGSTAGTSFEQNLVPADSYDVRLVSVNRTDERLEFNEAPELQDLEVIEKDKPHPVDIRRVKWLANKIIIEWYPHSDPDFDQYEIRLDDNFGEGGEV